MNLLLSINVRQVLFSFKPQSDKTRNLIIVKLFCGNSPSVEERRVITLAFKKKNKQKDKNLYIFSFSFLI